MLADRNSSPVETTDRYPKRFANCVASGATAAMTTAKGSVATAVCNAVYPRNAWNHWVVMKMKPNRQKNATQIAQVLLVNVALRNRPTIDERGVRTALDRREHRKYDQGRADAAYDLPGEPAVSRAFDDRPHQQAHAGHR